MNIIHTNELLVLFSKLLILNKNNSDKTKTIITASFADAFSAAFMYFLSMRPVWKIPILNNSPAMFDNIESFQDCRLFVEEAFSHQEPWKARIRFENREPTTP